MNLCFIRTLSYVQPIILVCTLCLLIFAIVNESWLLHETEIIKNSTTVKIKYEYGLWNSCNYVDGVKRLCTSTSKFNDDLIKIWLVLSACFQVLAVILFFCITLTRSDAITVVRGLFIGSSIIATICCLCGLIVFGARVQQSHFDSFEYRYAFISACFVVFLLVTLSLFSCIYVYRTVRSQGKHYVGSTKLRGSVNKDMTLSTNDNTLKYKGKDKQPATHDISASKNENEMNHTMNILDEDETPSHTKDILFFGNNDRVDIIQQHRLPTKINQGFEADSDDYVFKAQLDIIPSLVGNTSIKRAANEDNSQKSYLDDGDNSDTDSTAEVLREYYKVIALMEEQISKETIAKESGCKTTTIEIENKSKTLETASKNDIINLNINGENILDTIPVKNTRIMLNLKI